LGVAVEWGPWFVVRGGQRGAGGSVAVAGNDDEGNPRPGPDMIEADTWGEPALAASEYAGRHHTNSSSWRLRLAIGAGVLGLVAVVAIPMLLGGSRASAPPAVSAEPDLGGGQASASDASASPSTSPSPTAVPTSRPVKATAKPTPKPAPFTPITLEAEAGGAAVTLGGSAWIAEYPGASNGKIVRNLGDWRMRGGPGTLRFNGVTFPAGGSYILAISFVHPDNEPTRGAQVTVSGVNPVTVVFNGGSRCCDVKKITLQIPAGTRTITISNSRDRAPSIDKIVVSRA
jgi:hypothetical protein